MADLALVTSTQLEIDSPDPQWQCEGVAGVAITKGQSISLVAGTGVWQLADSDVETIKEQVYVALKTVGVGDALTGSKRCRITGFDVAAMNFGAKVYLSKTAGAWTSTVPSSGNTLVCGIVEPVFGNGATGDKRISFMMG